MIHLAWLGQTCLAASGRLMIPANLNNAAWGVLFSVPDEGIWLPWPSQAIAVMSLTSLSRLLLVQQSDHLPFAFPASR
jgi:hypothetical protein